MIRYEFECFRFFVIVKLFSAGNVKKNVFTVFIVPIVTIDGFIEILLSMLQTSSTYDDH